MSKEFEYTVAFSFAGEDRDYVRKVATILERASIKIFFDEFEELTLWGVDLAEHLHDVYSNQAKYCVIFISKYYASKAWPTHEKRSAIQRAMEQENTYILPARFDDTELPGLPGTISYINLNNYDAEAFAQLVIDKIGVNNPRLRSFNPNHIRKPISQTKLFNPYDEIQEFFDFFESELQNRSSIIRDAGASISMFIKGERFCIRIVAYGKTVYSLDVWRGGMVSDKGISFYGIPGEISGFGGSMNASAEIEWDAERDQAILELSDYSLLGIHTFETTRLTYSEFLNRIWDLFIDALDRGQ